MSVLQEILKFGSYIMWFIVVMIPLVTIHEFGHFIIARIFKVKVPEFGIGVPPKAIGKKWKGMTWSLNWLPMGAFVRITGDNDAIEKYYHLKHIGSEDKQGYINERIEEVLTLGDLELILDEHKIEITQDWKDLAKKYKNKEYVNSPLFSQKYEQLSGLIGLEYDKYLSVKDNPEIKKLFFSKNLIQKILILVGGVTFNVIGAFLIFMIALNTTGLMFRNTFENNPSSAINFQYLAKDKPLVDQSGKQFDNSTRYLIVSEVKGTTLPAKAANIPNNAQLIKINDIPSSEITNEKLSKLVNENPESNFIITYKNPKSEVNNSGNSQLDSSNDNATQSVFIKPIKFNERYVIGLGVTNTAFYKSSNIFTSIKDAFDHTYYYTELTIKETFKFFVNLFSPNYQKSIDQTASPVMISVISTNLFNQFGFGSILWIMALISLSLAVFNILPIPALDGGRIVLVILEKIFGSPIKKIEPYLVSSTYVVLLMFMLFIFGKDIFTLIKK